jgi:L,D-transpeptidase YcbB
MDHGREAWRSRVIIGKPDTQTFAFHDEIETIVFNPSWGVPQSIIKNEMLPLLWKDPSYLDRMGYRVIDKSGQIVHSSAVDWWSVGGKVIPYSVQQPPSDDNALGEIKFLFPNRHDIYMHDTPTKPLFEKPVRAYSHGCVRVEDPRRFGEVLLGWNAEEIAAKIESGRSESVKLPHKVPVHLTYFTAWPEADGRITFYDDVYSRDQRMERALGATEIASR